MAYTEKDVKVYKVLHQYLSLLEKDKDQAKPRIESLKEDGFDPEVTEQLTEITVAWEQAVGCC